MKGSTVLFALGLMFATATSALADQPGEDWMPPDQVKQKLIEAGYTEISKLEADDGHWEGEGVKGGKRVEFHVDPNTGAIVLEKPDK